MIYSVAVHHLHPDSLMSTQFDNAVRAHAEEQRGVELDVQSSVILHITNHVSNSFFQIESRFDAQFKCLSVVQYWSNQ